MRRLGLLLVVLAAAGCGAPAGTPPAASPAPTPATPEAPEPAVPTPPPAPVAPPEDDRAFSFTTEPYQAVERSFPVNATHRVVVSLVVRNVEPVAREWPANVLATGPNGTRQLDTGSLGEGGGAFALRLAPFHHALAEGPALVHVRVSTGVAAHVSGRIHVDGESDVSTVP